MGNDMAIYLPYKSMKGLHTDRSWVQKWTETSFDHGEYDNLSTDGFGDGGYSNYLEFTTMGYRGSRV